MLKEILEQEISESVVKEKYTNFKDMMKDILDKMHLKITWESPSDSYIAFKKDGKEYSVDVSWEGMEYVFKLMDDEGFKIAELPQKRFMDKDSWYLSKQVMDLLYREL